MVTRTQGTELTDALLATLKAGDKRADNARLPGGGRLVARCRTVSGGVAVDLLYRFYREGGASEVAMVLGQHSRFFTVEKARNEAARLSEMRLLGLDPQTARDEERAKTAARAREQEARLRPGSLADLMNEYIGTLERREAPSAVQVRSLVRRHLLKPWQQLCARPAAEIQPAEFVPVLAKMLAAGIENGTAKMHRTLRTAYNYGMMVENSARRLVDGLTALRFGIKENPLLRVPLEGIEGVRDRVLTDGELLAYLTKVNAMPAGPVQALLLVHLWTGARIKQLLRATWADYGAESDANGSELRFLKLRDMKGSKTKSEHLQTLVLPVPPRMAAVLDALPRGAAYIFPAPKSKSGHLPETKISGLVSSMAKPAGWTADWPEPEGGYWTAADIRRTVETRLAAAGVSKQDRAMLLSHGKRGDVQDRNYDRYRYVAERRATVEVWLRILDGLTVVDGRTVAS